MLDNPENFYKKLAPVTIKDCLESQSPAIGGIVVVCGVEKGTLLISAMLVIAIEDLNNYFNVTKPMNDVQAIETINLICQRFKHFRMDDFKLCFNRMKMGFYGKTYNRIDGQILFEALNHFNDERMDAAENLNRIKHEELKRNNVDYTDANKGGQAKVAEILKSHVKHVEEETKKIQRPKPNIDVMGQNWMRLFDKLHKKWGTSPLGTKYISRYGIKFNCSEFLEFKLKQHREVNKQLMRRKK